MNYASFFTTGLLHSFRHREEKREMTLTPTAKKLLRGALIAVFVILLGGAFFGETRVNAVGTTEAGKAFLAENALKEGVTTLPSGLQYRVLKSGPKGGPKPKVNTPCLCHYRGTTIEVRDASTQRRRVSLILDLRSSFGFCTFSMLLKTFLEGNVQRERFGCDARATPSF